MSHTVTSLSPTRSVVCVQWGMRNYSLILAGVPTPVKILTVYSSCFISRNQDQPRKNLDGAAAGKRKCKCFTPLRFTANHEVVFRQEIKLILFCAKSGRLLHLIPEWPRALSANFHRKGAQVAIILYGKEGRKIAEYWQRGTNRKSFTATMSL